MKLTRKRNRKFFAIFAIIFAFVLTSAILSFSGQNSFNSDAWNSANPAPATIGSLNFEDYGELTNGAVFDAAMLDKLYGLITGNEQGKDSYANAKTAVQDSTSLLYAPVDGNDAYPNTQPNSMNFSQLNDGNAITVEFGGYKWNVVYLTTNTNDGQYGKAGDLIATLWMSDCDENNVDITWNDYSTKVTTGTYHSSEYGASKIRLLTLNAGGTDTVSTQYSISIDTLSAEISAMDRANNSYAKFTMSNDALTALGVNSVNNNVSLVEYLASPSQVNYQKEENAIWAKDNNGGYQGVARLLLNDAWGEPDTTLTYQGSGGWFLGNKNNGYSDADVIDNKMYFDWKDDFLWLPSLCETGYYGRGYDKVNKMISIWGIPNQHEMLNSSYNYWVRSASDHGWSSINNNLAIDTNGALTGIYIGTLGQASVRPALHLNLTKAEQNSKYKVTAPSSVSKTYNGDVQGIEQENWFSDLGGDATVEYFKGSTKVTPIDADNYKAVITLGNKSFWAKGDDTDKSRTIDFYITKKALAYPKWFDDVNEMDYGGDGKLYYTLSNDYDKDAIDIKVPDALKDKVTFDSDEITATGLDAGTYSLEVSLKDTKNYQWATTGNKLEFIVNPKTIKLTDLSDGGNRTLVSSRDSALNLSLKIDANTTVHTGKQVAVNIVAQTDGLSKVVGTATLDVTSRDVAVDLKFTGTPNGRTYQLVVEIDDTKLDGKNYALNQDSFETTVRLQEGVRSMLTWQLMCDGKEVFGEYTDASVNQTSISFSGAPIVYNGKSYKFRVLLPDGYEMDTSFGIGGYKVTASTPRGDGTNADSYTTQIQLTSDGNKQIFEITWEIEKAKFDLSGVKWLNNGQIEYNDGQDVNPVIDPTTLPTGLLVNNYGGIKVGSEIGKYGAVTVNFKLADGYEGNYELPSSGGKGTNYIFNGDGDFEWDKEWEIVPAVIALDWIEKQVQDINGTMFNVLVLKDQRVEGKIDYLYYETDSQGNIDTSKQPLTADQIEVSATARKYYKAFPSIKSSYAGGYVFDGGEADYSGVFIVGGGATLITVSLESNTFEYNGKPVAIKVIINGAATVGNLTFTYYKGDIVDEANKIDGVPVDAGNYVVVIGSNSGSVMIEGETQFEFTITRSKVSKEWKMGAKPPVLNLKYGQINGIEYEIIDGSGNVITDISQITAGTYKIRAKIKDSVNYIFEDDTFETEYVEFTVREGDQLYDPTDPDNPNYPKDDDTDNPEPPTGGGDGGNVLDKIKDFFNKLIESNFPLWQVATSAVALLFTLIFMIKSIQYGNRKKKAKGEAKKYNAKTYAALLPIFSTQTVWLNLSNMVWSIIAFSICGVMLLMFLTMLITRKGWKKAELAKETAIEESEQRRFNSQNANQLALQEKIAQIGQVGGSTSNIEELLRQRDEAHRQEMAALREEQQKRDEAMKIMLANLMGRQQADSDIPYAAMDDTDLLVQKVIAGLLPAVQQMMPEATAYLAAPSEENEELKALVEEQNEEMRNMAAAHSEEMRAMTEKMCELQEQLSAMSQDRVEGVILPDQSEDIRALTERISELQEQLSQDRVEGILLPDNSEEIRNLEEKHSAEMQAMSAQMLSMQQKIEMMSAMSVDELDDDDLADDEEEWDSILDEDDDDFVEAVIIEEDGTVKKTYPNFRMRLKQSSDKNREWYAAVKNLFCSQKGVTYRVYKRVEKIRYQGQVIAVIGIAKRSIKLWLALKPYEYDARRYHHKDVSDKPRFVDVPMYVRVSSDRALTRAQELILALFQELNMEARKRYNDRSIQELIFTLKHNKLLTNKQNKGLLCEVMHVHDCDVLSDELAEKCIESKNVEIIDESYIETLKLDDIDAKFQDGNRVTLEKLKKVGLVSEDCTGYTVTAGQRLTKPLIIVANDFKLSAVKMITLTGGRAIKLNKV